MTKAGTDQLGGTQACASHLVLAAVGKLLESVTSEHAEVLSVEEVGTCSDEATVCQGSQRCPLSICQAGACALSLLS